jgi:ABC-type lipoprotein export system ATPase subunit
MPLVDTDTDLPEGTAVPTKDPTLLSSLIVDVDEEETIAFPHTHKAPLLTPMSNVTASTSQDDFDCSPVASPEQFSSGTCVSPSPPESVILQANTFTNRTTIDPPEIRVDALYSLRLPGIGKILAIKSDKACDVDDLYVDEKAACDVDAYVDNVDTDTDDDDSYYPPYPSSTTEATGHSYDDDLEANNNENSQQSPPTVHRIDPPLDSQTDPFAQRVGKKLSWRNVNMTLQTSKGQPNKKLLSDVWGEVPSTETTAIMGASGAGKTSLLNILAGRARTKGRIKIEADVRLENYSVDPTDIKIRKSIAFVAQDDSLQSTATPREAIRFSAKLRLPRSTTESQLDLLTNRMIHELGLSGCADTIVGGPLLKGISGGERKRASVGVELVVVSWSHFSTAFLALRQYPTINTEVLTHMNHFVLIVETCDGIFG